MNLCFSTLGCPDWSFEDIVATAVDLGYQSVEIRGVKNQLDGPRIPQFAPENAQATKDFLKKKNLGISILSSACYMNDKNIEEETMQRARAYVDTAAVMGIPYIRLLADYGPEQSGQIDTDFVAAQLKEIAKYAAPKNVTVLTETNGYYANSKRMEELMNKIAEPNMGVLWDIHHPYRYFRETPEYTLGIIGDFIRHVQVKDSVIENGKLRYVIVGSGDMPVAECAERLEKIGYDGCFSLEWLKRWDLSLEEPGIAFASYVSYMRSISGSR